MSNRTESFDHDSATRQRNVILLGGCSRISKPTSLPPHRVLIRRLMTPKPQVHQNLNLCQTGPTPRDPPSRIEFYSSTGGIDLTPDLSASYSQKCILTKSRRIPEEGYSDTLLHKHEEARCMLNSKNGRPSPSPAHATKERWVSLLLSTWA